MTEAELAFMRGDGLLPEEPRRGLQLKNLPEYTSQPWSEPRDVKIVDSPVLCRVPHCTRPSGDQFVCSACLDDLDVALGDVPALLEDLLVATTKQARFGGSGGKSTDTRPLPYNPAAADMAKSLGSAVSTAVRMLCEHRGIAQPVLDAPGASRWLLAHLHSVALDVAGPDMVAEIVRETKRARKMIDRPAESTYIGACACGADMYARPDLLEHRCGVCGKTWSVEERKAEIHQRLMGSLISVDEIVKLSAKPENFGARLNRKTVDSWVQRGRLARAGSKPNPKNPDVDTALYRAGDVLALVGERKSA